MQVYDFLRLARVGKGAVLVIWSSLVNRFVQLGIEFLGRPGALGDFIYAKSYCGWAICLAFHDFVVLAEFEDEQSRLRAHSNCGIWLVSYGQYAQSQTHHDFFEMGPRVPQPNGLIVTSRHHDRAAVDGAKCHGGDPARVSLKRLADRRLGARIPQPNVPTLSRDHERVAIDRAKRHCGDPVRVPKRLADRRSGVRIPQPNGRILTSRDHDRVAANLANRHGSDVALV